MNDFPEEIKDIEQLKELIKTGKIKKLIPGLIVMVVLIVVFVVVLVLPTIEIKRELACDKSKNLCTLYTKKVFQSSDKVEAQFKISDINGYTCERHRYKKSVQTSTTSNGYTRKSSSHGFVYVCYLTTKTGGKIEISNFNNHSLGKSKIKNIFSNIRKLPQTGEHPVYNGVKDVRERTYKF